MSFYLVAEDFQVPECYGIECHSIRCTGQALERAVQKTKPEHSHTQMIDAFTNTPNRPQNWSHGLTSMYYQIIWKMRQLGALFFWCPPPKKIHLIWTPNNPRKYHWTFKSISVFTPLPHFIISPEQRNHCITTLWIWAERCVLFLCAIYLSLLRTLSKLNSWRYWMSEPRQQITGLSREATLDSEWQPGVTRGETQATNIEFSKAEVHSHETQVYSKKQ